MKLLRRKPQRTDDDRARALGYDPDGCARGEHPWYVSWGFCRNPFCEAVMPGLRRVDGQPTCSECGAVTTLEGHGNGCTVGERFFKLAKAFIAAEEAPVAVPGSGEIYTIRGIDYRATRFDEYRCSSCQRVTLTGLCGCPDARPVKCGDTLIGLPVDAERAIWGSPPRSQPTTTSRFRQMMLALVRR